MTRAFATHKTGRPLGTLFHFMFALRLVLCALLFGGLAGPAIANITLTAASLSVAASSTTFVAIPLVTLSEGVSGDVSSGTIVFAAPSGFEFQAASGRIRIDNCTGGGTPTGSFVTTASTATFTISSRTSTTPCRFRIDRINVRPSTGAGAGTYTISNSGTSVLNGVGSATLITLTKTPASANKLTFGTNPTDAQAGVAISPAFTVRVEDTYGNLVTGSNAAVVISLNNNPGGSLINGASTQTVNASGGIASFSGYALNKIGTGYTFLATSSGLTSTTSAPFNITAGAPHHLSFSQQPTTTTATANISPAITVRVEDSQNNLVTSSTASITLAIASNPSSGTLTGTKTVQASGGIASFGDLSIDKAGSGYMLQATSSGLNSANSSNFTINVGAASKLVFITQPTSTTAGANISPAVVVYVQDAGGNTVTTNGIGVTLSIGTNAGGGTLGGTVTVNTSGGQASFSNLTINKAGNGYTLTASSGALTSANSNSFNISAGTASKLAFIQQPSNTTIAASITPWVTVQIQDVNGNATTSTATVTIAIGTNPSAGVLSGTLSKAAVSGLATFNNLAISKVGVGYTLTATSGSLTATTSTSFNITTNVGPPAKLKFSVQPTESTPGNIITPAITVEVQDASGLLVTTATNAVTLDIGNNPGSSNITGTLVRNAVNGVASFDDIALTNLGTGYTLTAAAAGLLGDTSTAFDISSLICFTDNFDSAASMSNWAVGNESGGVNPSVVSGRFQLTASANQVSTYATLQRLFPAAGNKIIVTFKYYSYNGTGADGIGVTLSDASVAPVAGAFGGSLGYAPKLISAGGEVNHPGFAGGWIGIALDEFGNYSANTEGRSGGSAPGFRPDSVAVRGSGSGYAGYAYLTGSGTQSTGIDLPGTTVGPGHAYRIIVDHTNGVNAMTSVERDVTGSGNSYTYLVSPFDAKSYATQAAVPTNWFLSFTGSTGGSTNIHAIDNLKVCSPVQQSLTLHHVRLEYTPGALMCGGASGVAPITIKACGNANCSTLYPGTVTVNLSTTAGTLSATSVTVVGGTEVVNLTKTTAGTATVTGSVVTPAVSTITCYTGSSEIACTNPAAAITFTSTNACFNATETNEAPGNRLLTKLVNTAFNLDIVALSSATTVNTSSTKQFSVSLVNPLSASGNCTDTATGLTAWSSTMQFLAADQGRKSVSFTYPNAAQNIRVRIRDTATGAVTCSTDDFTIRPYALSVTSSPTSANQPISSDTGLLRAGTDSFTVTTSPVNASNANVTGYAGFPRVDISKLVMNTGVAPLADVLATAPIATTPPTFQTTSTGTFTYNEAGTVFFGNLSLYDDVWVDHDIVNGDCFPNDFRNTLASGKYGCNFGNVSAIANNTFTAGRFIPDHFETVLTSTMDCGTLTFAVPCPGTSANMVYSGQPFTASVTAYRLGGTNGTGIATGYEGTAARNVTLAPCDTSGCASTTALNSIGALKIRNTSSNVDTGNLIFAPSTFTAGQSTLAATDATSMRFEFGSPFTAPTNVFLRASDTNGVTSLRSPASSSVEGGLKVISGRARILNTTGSDLSDTPVPARIEFWQANNQGWVVNPNDKTNATLTTSMVDGTVAGGLRIYDIGDKTGLGAGGTATPGNTDRVFREENDTGYNGIFNLWVKAPGSAATVDITLGVPLWLQYNWTGSGPSSPIGRVSFGKAKRSRVVYRQEMLR